MAHFCKDFNRAGGVANRPEPARPAWFVRILALITSGYAFGPAQLEGWAAMLLGMTERTDSGLPGQGAAGIGMRK